MGGFPINSLGEQMLFCDDGRSSREDVEIFASGIEGWIVESEGNITVAIDTHVNDELIAEGYAREFVNRIQNMRKDSGFDVIDRINVSFKSEQKMVDYVSKFSDYISSEVLADSLESKNNIEGFKNEFKIGDYDCTIVIVRVKN
jgi:isoleucyl-tRNA synthetase